MPALGGPRVVVMAREGDDNPARQALRELPAPTNRPRRVLLKPNMLNERHLLNEEYRHVITQPEVLFPAFDWVRSWVDPHGEVMVADAPTGSADMSQILDRTGVEALLADRGELSMRIEDLRLVKFNQVDGVPITREDLVGDSHGTVRVNLGRNSGFYGLLGRRYYGADYDIAETNSHHRGEVQEYMFSGSALESDVVVNLPKLKTHKKAGLTASLKNLVGLNGNKNWLPHHAIGTPSQGGDAYPNDSVTQRLENNVLEWLKPRIKESPMLSEVFRLGRKTGESVVGDTQTVVRSGNWWGNDTIWRMILDLNRVLLYATPAGEVATTPQRALYSVVDGLVAGDGNGPEAPDPYDAGIVVAGESFAAVDLVCAKLMGFDYRRIPHLSHVFDHSELPLVDFEYGDIEVTSNRDEWSRRLVDIKRGDCMDFRPHFGWTGHIEA